MKVIAAQESDSERLNEYFARQKVDGVFEYSVERSGSFFDKYRSISNDFQTFMLVDGGEIEGVATLVFMPTMVEGQLRTIGIALDLRVSHTRRAILHWAQLFFGEFQRVSEERGCDLIFSGIERFEGEAYNALIRPQRSRRSIHRYYLFWKFYVVSLYGLVPWAPKPLRSLWIEEARAEDLEELSLYMKKKNEGRLIYFSKEPDDLNNEFKRLASFDWRDLLIARDHDRNIVGCLGLWNNQSIQNLRVHQYHGTAEALRQSLYFASLVSRCHKLPAPGELLKSRTITHLYFDNTDIFYTLLFNAWKRINKDEIIIYNCFKGDYGARPPSGFIYSQIPYGLYTILSPNKILPDFLRPNPWIMPPEFDLRIF